MPPVILGRLKQPLAERLKDKVLHTDSLMQKADWMTGVAGIAGVAGVGFGFWWADAAAAALIALDIVHDGYRAARVATAELIDGAPRELGQTAVAEDAKALQKSLAQRFPNGEVRLRETGRYIVGEVVGERAPDGNFALAEYWTGNPDDAWRFAELSFVPEQPPTGY